MAVTLLKSIARAYSEHSACGDRAVVDVYDSEPNGRGLLIRVVGVENRHGQFEGLLFANDYAPIWTGDKPSDWPEFAWSRPAGAVPVCMDKVPAVSLVKS
jgi:hypothetical protein